MKFFSSILILTILCSFNVFAWTASINGPANPPKGEKYDYKASYVLDENNKNKELEKVEYYWTIVGDAIADKKTSKDNPTAIVTMINPTNMGNNYQNWPKGWISCTIILYFKDGTKEAKSDKIELVLVP